VTASSSLYRAARRLRVQLAREDPNALIEFLIRDERTGHPVRQSDVHRKWQAIASNFDEAIILAAIGHGKSSQLVVGRTLFEIIRNPRIRIVIISRTEPQAQRFLRVIAYYLESRELREVASGLVVHATENEIFVGEDAGTRKDPTVQPIGLGSAITGNRTDLLILDDVVNWRSTREQEARDKTDGWIASEALTRIEGQGARVLAIGTHWHPDDALHRLAARGWPTFKFPAEKEDGSMQWPERWTRTQLEKLRRRLGPHEAACALDLVPRSDAESTFQQSWIDVALARGAGKQAVPALAVSLPKVFTGVDLAISKKAGSDRTALVTMRVHPDGTRQLLWVESGHWLGPMIEQKIFDVHARFGSVVVVESVAAQQYLIDYTRQHSAVPIIAFQTRAGEMSLPWQANRLATELANGKWIIPSTNGRANHPEIAALVKEVLYFDPRHHCGDRLAAAIFSRWGAENVGRQQAGYFNIGDLTAR
jgi:hypothetical protein